MARVAVALVLLSLTVIAPLANAATWMDSQRARQEVEGLVSQPWTRYAPLEQLSFSIAGRCGTVYFSVDGPEGFGWTDSTTAGYCGGSDPTQPVVWMVPWDASPGSYTLRLDHLTVGFDVVPAPTIWTNGPPPTSAEFAQFEVRGFDPTHVTVEVSHGRGDRWDFAVPASYYVPSAWRAPESGELLPTVDVGPVGGIGTRVSALLFANTTMMAWVNGTRDGEPASAMFQHEVGPGPAIWIGDISLLPIRSDVVSTSTFFTLVGEPAGYSVAEVFVNRSLHARLDLPERTPFALALGTFPYGDLSIIVGAHSFAFKVERDRASLPTHSDPSVGTIGTLLVVLLAAVLTLRRRRE